MTIDRGAEACVFAALLPANSEIRGAYIWHDCSLVDWVNGPLPELLWLLKIGGGSSCIIIEYYNKQKIALKIRSIQYSSYLVYKYCPLRYKTCTVVQYQRRCPLVETI